MSTPLHDDELVMFAFDGVDGLPDFGALAAEDFRSGFDLAMARHRQEIRDIAENPNGPTFENTLGAMERSGEDLTRVASLFYALAGANTNEALQAVEREVSPKLSRHGSAISLDPQLFARIDALFAAGDARGPEEARLLERTHAGFVRRGARLEGDDRERLTEINARLSELGTAFSQNVLADETSFAMAVSEADLEALPDFLVASMRQAAEERGLPGPVVTLARSIVVPFLTHCPNRALRQTVFAAWTKRGENKGGHDNRGIVKETLELRAEKARLLGFPSFAHYKLDDTMAKTPQAVRALLSAVWEKAVERARQDAQTLQALAQSEGENGPIEPHDWRYYAEKRRRAEFDMDEGALKAFFSLDAMIEAAFDVAHRLFGLSFEPLADARAFHPDARVWRVTGPDGAPKALFVGDYFARGSKRSGAWMSALRSQHKLDGGQTPIIYNVCNFAKPAKGAPALLSMDDARTLFHEFGHALHGMMSDVTWPSLSGTSVARDFVELPSQLYEHWLGTREVLGAHARHVETGKPLPAELADRVEAARTFDTGFDTVEYTACALVDLALHESADAPADPMAREAQILAEIGMPREIVMRHRSPHFSHVFSGDGYSSGYYSYMWSEVLDADAFEAFEETGDPFHRETAERLARFIYSAGNSRDPAELYEAFRGRMPTPDALMRKRGLA